MNCARLKRPRIFNRPCSWHCQAFFLSLSLLLLLHFLNKCISLQSAWTCFISFNFTMRLWDRYYAPHFTDDNTEARKHEVGATELGCNLSCPLLNSVFMYHNPSLDFLSYSLSQKRGVFSLFLLKDTRSTDWTRGSRGRSPGTACTGHTCGRGLHVGACVHVPLKWGTGLEDGDKGGREKRPEGGSGHPQTPCTCICFCVLLSSRILFPQIECPLLPQGLYTSIPSVKVLSSLESNDIKSNVTDSRMLL